MTDWPARNLNVEDTDIVFECPNCYKSLAIDEKAAGLFISCPECGERMQIPSPPERVGSPVKSSSESSKPLNQDELASLGLTRERVIGLLEDLKELKGRRVNLEKMRIDTFSRFEKISEELTVIQAAIDRVLTIIQEAPSDYRKE